MWKIKVICSLMSMMIMLSACGNGKKYEGTYLGQAGSVLVLKEDGTCRYKEEDDYSTREGTWAIEDDKLIVRDCLNYDIYADIENDSESLLFEADTLYWSDELFIKSK